jgi:hypothetical protein
MLGNIRTSRYHLRVCSAMNQYCRDDFELGVPPSPSVCTCSPVSRSHSLPTRCVLSTRVLVCCGYLTLGHRAVALAQSGRLTRCIILVTCRTPIHHLTVRRHAWFHTRSKVHDDMCSICIYLYRLCFIHAPVSLPRLCHFDMIIVCTCTPVEHSYYTKYLGRCIRSVTANLYGAEVSIT